MGTEVFRRSYGLAPEASTYTKLERASLDGSISGELKLFHAAGEDILDTRVPVSSGAFSVGTIGVSTSGNAYMLKQVFMDEERRKAMAPEKRARRPEAMTLSRVYAEMMCGSAGAPQARPAHMLRYGRHRDKAIICTPLLDTPLLEAYIFSVRNHRTEPHMAAIYDVAMQVGTQLANLHAQEIVHNDVTGFNVLVSGDRLILIDYGKSFSFRRDRVIGDNINSNPPETVLANFRGALPKHEDFIKVDVWQFACLILTILEINPFRDIVSNSSCSEDKEVAFLAMEAARGGTGEVPGSSSLREHMIEFWRRVDALPGAFAPTLRAMLAYDPAERPDVPACLRMFRASPIAADPNEPLPWYAGRPSQWKDAIESGFAELTRLQSHLLHVPRVNQQSALVTSPIHAPSGSVSPPEMREPPSRDLVRIVPSRVQSSADQSPMQSLVGRRRSVPPPPPSPVAVPEQRPAAPPLAAIALQPEAAAASSTPHVAIGMTVGLISTAVVMVASYTLAPWTSAPLWFWAGSLSAGMLVGFGGAKASQMVCALYASDASS